ncbi:FBD-associated F-box protein At2g26860-like [Bidens hawaiensis]|uniref:FBD-associated F-box protein At2g26860-like n=1 Tax=Bidens hawaiensis TaxID=980011 RepID=UPI00404920B8
MDRISQLPEFIIHEILSCINGSPTELVRMSVLSKTWFHLTASFPHLYFNMDDFKSRETFFKYIEYTTSRFCRQDVVTARTFKIVTTIHEHAELDIVNRCLELVFKKGVKALEIDITRKFNRYRLPNTLLSVSALKSLTICGCELPSSFKVNVVKFKSLICLKLESVSLDDEVITYLTASCPLLKDFHIKYCHGFKRFCVYRHQNLQKVVISYKTRVERIDIEAPNLCTLGVLDWAKRGAPQMNLASCKKLTFVAYYGCPLPGLNCFTDFLSNFPFIEKLLLSMNYKCNNLKLSSPSLRTLLLDSQCDLEEIELSTPNLVSFNYLCNLRIRKPRIHKPWISDPTCLNACMRCYPNGCIDALWFQKWRRFLDKKNKFKVLNLYVHAAYSQKFEELEKLKALELPPYELEHVELQLESHEESLAHIAFVNAVLWCCRPRSLTFRSSFSFEEQSDVVKFTYEKLLEQEDQGHTNIKIVSPSSSLLMALLREEKAIRYIKEE